MQGVITALRVMDGKVSKFSNITVNGQTASAFGDLHQAAVNMKEGDTINYEIVQKGKYFNFSSLSLAATGAAVVQHQSAHRQQQEFLSKEEGVITSYAKDLLVGGISATPEAAVEMVFSLIKGVKTKMKENPTS